MTVAYLLIFGTIGLLSISVIAVFAWAIRSGQFADFQGGATSIFDEDEPMGEMTDWFPGQPQGRPGPVAHVPPATQDDHAEPN